MTYAAARAALLAHLATLPGWMVKAHLKVPQAVMPSGDMLYFKTRAVYLNAHSLWADIRKYTPTEFVEFALGVVRRNPS